MFLFYNGECCHNYNDSFDNKTKLQRLAYKKSSLTNKTPTKKKEPSTHLIVLKECIIITPLPTNVRLELETLNLACRTSEERIFIQMYSYSEKLLGVTNFPSLEIGEKIMISVRNSRQQMIIGCVMCSSILIGNFLNSGSYLFDIMV